MEFTASVSLKVMSQCDDLLNLLKDGKPHRTDEILLIVYGGEHLGIARIGARIADLKKKGYEIKGWKDPEKPTLYWYQMIIEKQRFSDYNLAVEAIHKNIKWGDAKYIGITKLIADLRNLKKVKGMRHEDYLRHQGSVIYYANTFL